MKKLFTISLLLFVAASTIFSQEKELTESEKLFQQINVLYQQGKFDEAISLAEKAVDIEKEFRNGNSNL